MCRSMFLMVCLTVSATEYSQSNYKTLDVEHDDTVLKLATTYSKYFNDLLYTPVQFTATYHSVVAAKDMSFPPENAMNRTSLHGFTGLEEIFRDVLNIEFQIGESYIFTVLLQVQFNSGLYRDDATDTYTLPFLEAISVHSVCENTTHGHHSEKFDECTLRDYLIIPRTEKFELNKSTTDFIQAGIIDELSDLELLKTPNMSHVIKITGAEEQIVKAPQGILYYIKYTFHALDGNQSALHTQFYDFDNAMQSGDYYMRERECLAIVYENETTLSMEYIDKPCMESVLSMEHERIQQQRDAVVNTQQHHSNHIEFYFILFCLGVFFMIAWMIIRSANQKQYGYAQLSSSRGTSAVEIEKGESYTTK